MNKFIKKILCAIVIGVTIFAQLSSNLKSVDLKAESSMPDAWNIDDSIRNSLEEIKLTDSSMMNIKDDATLNGNVVSFGPSIGAFKHYSSYEKHTNIRIYGSFAFSDVLGNWQRVILKANDISDGGGNGYFFSLDMTSFALYRQVNKTYVTLYWSEYPKSLTDSIGSLYDGMYRDFVFECYTNNDKSVVINMAIDGVNCCQVVDSGTQEKDFFNIDIDKSVRKNYPESGYTALAMNSIKDSWYIKGDFTDASFNEDTYLGNKDLYSVESTCNIENENLTFTKGQNAFLQEENSLLNSKITFKSTNCDENGKLFAIGAFTSKAYRNDYGKLDGLVIDIYKDKVEILEGKTVLNSLNGLDLINKEIEIKIIAISVAKECELAICINSTWLYGSSRNLANNSGYFGLYSFSNTNIKAGSYAIRNYRVLFLGNSITSHSPNESLNYGIGTIGDVSWGMATSAPEFDYVHRVVADIKQINGYENIEYMAVNVAAWEQNIATAPISSYYANAAAFEADLIVIKLGENTTNNPAYFTYAYYFDQLINYFKTNKNANVIIATQYWGSDTHLYDSNVDRGVIQVARENNYPLVRLGDLGSTYASINNASADEEYYETLTTSCPSGKTWKDEYAGWTLGVKQHPGMVGHENIAARISESVVNYLTGKDAYIDKEKEILDGVYAEYTTSNLYGNVKGAYDYKKCSDVTASEITDLTGVTFPENYYCYKAFNINHDGDIYRLTLDLTEDENANLNYKAFTEDEKGNLVELTALNDADYTRDAHLSICGDIKDKVYIAVEYNPASIFIDKTLSNEKFAAELKFINKNNKNFVIDVSSLKYTNLTITKNLYPAIISSNKDVEIVLATGKILIERKVFETISSTSDSLYFTISQLSSTNSLRNATSALNSLNNDKATFSIINSSSSGYCKDVYEVQIRYNGRSGDALYINSGITFELAVNLDETKLNNLAVVSSYLPALGSNVKFTELLNSSNYHYENGTLYLNIKDYNNSIILAYSSISEQYSLNEIEKRDYYVGDEFDTSFLEIKHVTLDGQIELIKVTEDMVSGYNKDVSGTQTITIKYYNETFEYEIEVKQKKDETSSSEITSEENTSDDNQDTKPKKKGCKGEMTSSLLVLIGLLGFVNLKKNRK